MFKAVTIIVQTKNSEEHINKTFKELIKYQHKHACIQKIIFADNHSTDKTIETLMNKIQESKDPNITLIIQPKTRSPKRILEIAIEESDTDNIIILESNLGTCLGQIRKQNKLLNRCDLVLPNRLSRTSRTNYTPKPDEWKKHQQNRKKTGYYDSLNTQKALRKNKILPILKITKEVNDFWNDTITLCKEARLKITETNTNWNNKQ